jgi:hypothetical protein
MAFKSCERLEIKFLTCLTSYNKCDTENGRKQVSGISHLQIRFQRDFCDTTESSDCPLASP